MKKILVNCNMHRMALISSNLPMAPSEYNAQMRRRVVPSSSSQITTPTQRNRFRGVIQQRVAQTSGNRQPVVTNQRQNIRNRFQAHNQTLEVMEKEINMHISAVQKAMKVKENTQKDIKMRKNTLNKETSQQMMAVNQNLKLKQEVLQAARKKYNQFRKSTNIRKLKANEAQRRKMYKQPSFMTRMMNRARGRTII